MMFVLAVTSLCVGAFSFGMLALVCRHRKASWFASDTFILCFGTPVAMLLVALGVAMLWWVAIRVGVAALAADALIGSVVIIALFAGSWRLLAPLVSGRRRTPVVAAPAPFGSARAGT